MPSKQPTIPILSSIAPLAASCDAWISDIWGVLHNGLVSFKPACDAARAFRARGGTVCLLSNAPRPRGSVAAQLDGLGVPRDAWDAIVTSGDLTRRLIGAAKGAGLFHLGPEKDKAIFTGLDARFVAEADADLVVCSGLFDDDIETPDDYRAMLEGFARRNVAMICGNPDIKVERGERLVYCAGAVAELYEQMGGKVTWAGKPHLPAYELAFEELAAVRGGTLPKDRILAIGDGLRTDIKGAANAGLRSVFIASALHVEVPLSEATIADLFKDTPIPPIAAQSALVW